MSYEYAATVFCIAFTPLAIGLAIASWDDHRKRQQARRDFQLIAQREAMRRALPTSPRRLWFGEDATGRGDSLRPMASRPVATSEQRSALPSGGRPSTTGREAVASAASASRPVLLKP